MTQGSNIDDILRDWAFDPGSVIVRCVKGSDGRDVIQMRIDMGLLQLEAEGRPDGEKPHEFPTYYDYLLDRELNEGATFEMTEDECFEVDREFVQFYHRRVCWLALYEYNRAVADADHTLKLMDLCTVHSPEEQWTLFHEQYRPFVLFHRTQAAALAELKSSNDETSGEESEGGPESAEAAVMVINSGLEQMRAIFEQHEAEDQFEDDELVSRLTELREQLRERYDVGQTLPEKLADAIAAEQYEMAAKLRDELSRRKLKLP